MTKMLGAEGRIELREPSKRDQSELLARVRASAELHRPWASPPSTPEAYAEFVARSRRGDVQAYLIKRRADGALVGMAVLSQIYHGPLKTAYLGFNGFAPHDGEGYMAEGVRAVLRHAFRDLRLHRVEANVQPGNRRSKVLLRRCNFRREGFSPRYLKIRGRWRDHERWAILADDWADFNRSAKRDG